LVEGVPIENIIATLEDVTGIPGRFEKVVDGQNFTVIVDYSHTPDSLENCLKTAQEFAEGRIITVFGCGGDRDRTKRPLMGEVAGKLSDFVIVTSDNPRTEDPNSIIHEIIPGLVKSTSNDKYIIIKDRREAIYFAVKMAKDKDVVIIAGKGHETYQIIGKEIIPFDDRIVARDAIRDKQKQEI
jgi:UDP-N-acetylmuramoyl-L-alanyl-D-glutamate--2,6-diaminopimelate ligase